MKVTVRSFGESAILLDWPTKIDENLHKEIVAVNALIQDTYATVLVETVVTYHSIAVYLKDMADSGQCILELENLISKDYEKALTDTRLVTIPVCYEEAFALDIATVAATHDLSAGEVIAFHTAPIYPVYFLGFLPGFPYLGGLDKKLHTPRRDTPRLQIAAGSVAIGGSQTGIYPSNSPGGWNIIGKTPIRLFDLATRSSNLLQAGDRVKFEAISLLVYEQIAQDIKSGTFQLKITSL